LNGDVSVNERNKIITAFKTSADPHVLLCHPKVMAHGLNLTEADMCIFYGPIYSNDEFQQVVERFNRPGQTRKMTVIRMGAMKLEFDIYAALDKKQEGQETILDMYKRIVS
jgi:SNF2 family DNA or RNA helicase